MTSLKIKYANEIAEAMAKTLGDESFTDVFYKQAALNKEAGPVLEAYKRDLAAATDENTLRQIWNKHLPALQAEENVEEGALQSATCAQAAKAQELGLPGYQVPGCPEDNQMAQDVEEDMAYMANDAWDKKHASAADLTLTKLAKLADTLDNKGFSKIADIIDEAIQKISKKKDEKPLKGAETRPPKEWLDHWKKKLKDEEGIKSPAKLIGHIWNNVLNDKQKAKIKDGKVNVWVSPKEFAKAKGD